MATVMEVVSESAIAFSIHLMVANDEVVYIVEWG